MRKNQKIIARLSRYKNVLYRFQELGFEKIFSDYLGEEIGVTSSQVRKDFSIFGITGNKRAGYKISELIEKLEHIFHKEQVQKVVIIGSGRLGSALSSYRGFLREGIEVVAAFDIDPSKLQKSGKTPVYPLADMENFIKEHSIEIAILTVPERAAHETYDKLLKAGIRGILNFAPIPLKSTDDCIVSTYCVEVELENIIYFVNEAKKSPIEEIEKNEE